jgi:sugar phosphate isomerase/epimerase
MKIGISTKALPLRHWERELAKQEEFRTVEIDTNSSTIPTEENSLETLKNRLEIFDLSIHSAYNLFHRNLLIAKAEMAKFEYHSWLATKLGARQIVFHVSKSVGPENLKLFLETFKKVVEEGEAKFLLENNTKGPFSCEDEILWLCDKVPELGICIDVGHLHRAFFKGYVKDEIKTLKLMQDKICYVHLHDNHGEMDEHLALGKGNIRWNEIMPLMETINPGKAILEMKNLADVDESVNFLKDNGWQ